VDAELVRDLLRRQTFALVYVCRHKCSLSRGAVPISAILRLDGLIVQGYRDAYRRELYLWRGLSKLGVRVDKPPRLYLVDPAYRRAAANLAGRDAAARPAARAPSPRAVDKPRILVRHGIGRVLDVR
jgi:hypothetical protein